MKDAQSFARELSEVYAQRDILERERDELKVHLQRLSAQLENRRRLLWSEPGEFYSPIVNPDDRHALARSRDPLPNPPFDRLAMLSLFERIATHYQSVPFPETKTEGKRYYFENPAFSYSDAVALFGIIMEFRPKRLIEAGSGFSSCVSMDTNDAFFGGAIEMTFMDPYPQTLLALIPEDDPYRRRVKTLALQDAPDEMFSQLQANDILFIDTSHVAKTGSDVNDAVFRIFPLIAAGVLIHVHDIFDGFEYPEKWIIEENRSWNEAYLLRAFLENNCAVEIIYFNDWLYKNCLKLIQNQMPLCARNSGGSIWLRKKTNG